MTRPIRTIIVDDELLGRQAVYELLCNDARFEVVTQAGGGRDAIKTIGAVRPDLLFLDIQMPEVDGFDVLAALGDDLPVIVMVTAFNQHALRAFEHCALDYVLKPIDPERFDVTLTRVIERVNERRAGQRNVSLVNLLKELDSHRTQADRIILKASGMLLCLHPDELQWIESAGNYIKLHVEEDVYLMRETMGGISRRLNPAQFVRIHRSAIVNVREVRELRADRPGGECIAILRDGTEIAVGRTNRGALEACLGND